VRRAWFLRSVLLLIVTIAVSGRAAVLNTLVSFNNTNGAGPYDVGLIADGSGNLYGTTENGGTNGKGTLFKLDASNNYALTTLTNFNSGTAFPHGSLLADALGNLYGATEGGGGGNGAVFKLTIGSNSPTVLAGFNYSNGSNPSALIADAAGNLYGTTQEGGANASGTVFKIAAGSNTLTTLVNFNGSNGSQPNGALVADAAGNLYGTTMGSGSGANANGNVFKLDPTTSAFTSLASFTTATGTDPNAALIFDASGNLAGTTFGGGANGDGTVFKLVGHTLTALASFNGINGAHPDAGVIADAAGNLYGTTGDGGANNLGTVFKLTHGSNALSVLASFDGSTNGQLPHGRLLADASGNLFGTTLQGGPGGYGTVFELTNTGFVVPEPSSLALLACAIIFTARRRQAFRLHAA